MLYSQQIQLCRRYTLKYVYDIFLENVVPYSLYMYNKAGELLKTLLHDVVYDVQKNIG